MSRRDETPPSIQFTLHGAGSRGAPSTGTSGLANYQLPGLPGGRIDYKR